MYQWMINELKLILIKQEITELAGWRKEMIEWRKSEKKGSGNDPLQIANNNPAFSSTIPVYI